MVKASNEGKPAKKPKSGAKKVARKLRKSPRKTVVLQQQESGDGSVARGMESPEIEGDTREHPCTETARFEFQLAVEEKLAQFYEDHPHFYDKSSGSYKNR